jgi:RNA polymerase sigma-70 factor (ECF subfamily)
MVGVGMENLATLGARRSEGQPDEEELLAVRARTEPDAFGLLYEAHAVTVYRYLRARGADEDLAEELTAISFERALRAIGHFRPGRGGFRPWLLAIARNAWVDGYRRRIPVADLAAVPDNATPSPSPEAAAVAAEERALVRRLLSELPDVARDALALRYAGGLPSRDIAQVIGKSEDATKKLLSRSLASLREAARHDR